ncbi:carbohydrate ABC transporter permease [Dictyobacter kobayashii]|uniref:Sugar ABC transporter permease n=1 Tax=Dictyobacter kobayashii TaxID=2014872 RepID=A0A402AUX6_9CHLR|nr:sugar ABC transporter permease [Dictyobacter kobayashii]GCE22926.1 sugar ABC transporter permease [Dictyobacter kobayashii]
MAFAASTSTKGLGQDRRGKRKRSHLRAYPGSYLFILPSFIGVLIFTAFPVLFAFYMSLHNWDGISDPSFNGLGNYLDFLTDDLFWTAIRNTLIYTLVTMPVSILVSLGVAVLLNQRVRGLAFFRTAMFIPVVTSALAVSVIWKWIYDFDNGLINDTLLWLHLPPIPWLSSPVWALVGVCIIGVWQSFGFSAIVLLAAIQNISESVLQAAVIDGANSWQRFWRITFPLISPSLLFVSINSFVGSFQVFTQVYYITNGGPDYGTTVLNFLVFQRAFRENRFGSAAALSYVMFAIIFVVTIIQLRLSRNAVNAAAESNI